MAVDETRSIRVWDVPTRLFHWALAALVATSLTSVELKNMDVHVLSGQFVLGLLLFRLIWGVAGTAHARFGSFVRGPGAIVGYARSMVKPPHELHVGHNPLGGLVVVLMLLVLALQAVTGLFSNDDIATDGPFVRYVSKATSDAISSLHRRNGYVIYALVGLHIVAVFGYLLVFRENLIRPMITGIKEVPARLGPQGVGRGRTVLGLVLLAACLGAVWLVVRLPRMLATG